MEQLVPVTILSLALLYVRSTAHLLTANAKGALQVGNQIRSIQFANLIRLKHLINTPITVPI